MICIPHIAAMKNAMPAMQQPPKRINIAISAIDAPKQDRYYFFRVPRRMTRKGSSSWLGGEWSGADGGGGFKFNNKAGHPERDLILDKSRLLQHILP